MSHNKGRGRGKGPGTKAAHRSSRPTVEDVLQDSLTPLAQKYWAPGEGKREKYNAQIVQDVYKNELKDLSSSRIAILEFSQYFENYLWVNYTPDASYEHVFSIILMVNEKFRDTALNVWDGFHVRKDLFPGFLTRAFNLPSENPKMTVQERTAHMLFIIHCFETMEDPVVNAHCLRIVNIHSWRCLSQHMLSRQLRLYPRLKVAWGYYEKLRKKATTAEEDKHKEDAEFVPHMLDQFYDVLNAWQESKSAGKGTSSSNHTAVFCERFLELLTDLLSQLRTRRYLLPVLQDQHFAVRCQLSGLARSYDQRNDRGSGKLFLQLLEKVKFYMGFEMDEQKGTPLTDQDMLSQHYEKIQRLQKIAFKHFRPALSTLALTNVASIDTRDALRDHLSGLPDVELYKMGQFLRLFAPCPPEEQPQLPRDFVEEVIVSHLEKRESQQQKVQAQALYPTEKELWDQNLVPPEHYQGDTSLALPKLNLQFLTMHDYMLRNFQLYRMESTYEIREDIAKAIKLIKPELSRGSGKTVFTGYARYAVPLHTFTIRQVKKPLIGQTKPAEVVAEVVVDLSPFKDRVRREWERIRKHDVLFLITVEASPVIAEALKSGKLAALRVKSAEDLGVKFVRGLEVIQVKDESKQVINELDQKGKFREPVGNLRRYKARLDSAQYQADMAGVVEGRSDDPYKTFNLVMRRDPKENNFKAVLETIRDLMAEQVHLPKWLRDVFLGYGNAHAAQYYKLPNQLTQIDFRDTFLSLEHLREALPGCELQLSGEDLQPPFRITFEKGVAPQLEFHTYTPPSAGAATPAAPTTATDTPTTGKRKRARPESGADSGQKAQKRSRTSKGKGQDQGSASGLTEARVKSMKVRELKEALAERNITMKGKKDVLQKALLKAVRAEQQHQGGEEEEEKESGAAPSAMDTDGPEQKKAAGTYQTVQVESYVPEEAAIFASHTPKRNQIRFTSMQVEAIKSGVNPGLTLIVGPPGTGKTDVAVQIISELFHNFPEQRTLLVTHSNHALNDLFSKIMERDIDERFLLRLGHGEEGLRTEKDFSKFGRVNYMLERRIKLLEEVARLATTLGHAEDVAYTCETATHFFTQNVLATYERFKLQLSKKQQQEDSGEEQKGQQSPAEYIASHFPFSKFFQEQGQVFTGDADRDLKRCDILFGKLQDIFTELEETRPFELLRRGHDRGNYLLTKHAKVIAMTCTHAAMKRGNLAHDLRFQFDNIIMEEAAQVLEIETFIPLMLQKADDEFGDRLKRVILLGDHHQLPPVIQNMAFQKYSHMEQSLFARFVRLGMPTIQLNAQGRMRPSLASLWNWRYKNLGNLPAVLPAPDTDTRFSVANSGFVHDFQFINVEDFEGRGEFCPVPFFYQNLGEAEYVVQVYMYMRLLGYPADRISIITTYNGQKALIKNVIDARCTRNPLYGAPRDIDTVDKFQGQQNDYVLLSLVRTRTAGHIRDVRRLVVAMSRARFGLFVFGRQSLFQNCLELTPVFNTLLKKPTKLEIVPTEQNNMTPRKLGEKVAFSSVNNVEHMGQIVANLQHQVEQENARYQKQVAEFRAAEEKKRAEEERKKQRLAEQQRQQEQEAKDAADREAMSKAEVEAEKQMESAELEFNKGGESMDTDGADGDEGPALPPGVAAPPGLGGAASMDVDHA